MVGWYSSRSVGHIVLLPESRKRGQRGSGSGYKTSRPTRSDLLNSKAPLPKGFTAKADISCSDLDRVLVVICTVARACFETRATYRAEICFIHNAAIKINDDLSLSF